MKALVLGGTGHLGNAMVRELLGRGWDVTAAMRGAPKRNLRGLPVGIVMGDAGAPGQLDAWTRGHDVIVDAAAPYPLSLRDGDRSEGRSALASADLRTTALLEAIRPSGARLAYVSSFTTQPARRSPLDDLEARLARRVHPYFAVKDLIEARILAAATDWLDAVVVCPTLCIGPWDSKPRELCWPASVVRGELPVAMRHSLNVVDVRDVALCLVNALEAGRRAEPILVTGHDISLMALCRRICEAGGGRPPRLEVPSPLGLVGSLWAESLGSLGGTRTPATALATLLACQHHSMSVGRAQIELGVHPRSLSATVSDTIDWYRDMGYC